MEQRDNEQWGQGDPWCDPPAGIPHQQRGELEAATEAAIVQRAGGADGIWLASFMHYDLGYFDLEQKTLQRRVPAATIAAALREDYAFYRCLLATVRT